MNQIALFGTITALFVGLFVGFQAIVGARASLADNAISTGLVMFIAGGVVAAILLAALSFSGQLTIAPLSMTRIVMMVLGGFAGVVIVSGSAYAFANISPAAAVALIIFGQMFLAMTADCLGWTGQAPQTVDLRRIGGLVLLAGSIWLLIPKTD